MLTDHIRDRAVREHLDPVLLGVIDPGVPRLVVGLDRALDEHRPTVVGILLNDEVGQRHGLPWRRTTRAAD
ncbi:MAG: hypothetical protein LC679_08340 [Intrasporangiaceae bacterium]|nr:hypothetical protein [Intrasporangiaceae bacterium]